MGVDTRHIDESIVDKFGTSSENAYFVEDMLMPAMLADGSLRSFIGVDNTEVTFWFDMDALYAARGRDISPEEAERMCDIVVRDFNEVPAKVEKYRLDGDVTALEQYREEHGDVKLADIGTYSAVAYARHMREDVERGVAHCDEVISRFEQTGQGGVPKAGQFDAAAFCDVRDTMRRLHLRASDLGIDEIHTPLGRESLRIDKRRLECGLFAENIEFDIYSDMYKDQYGFRPRGVHVRYISTADEDGRRKAVSDLAASRDWGKSMIDAPGLDGPSERQEDGPGLSFA